MSKHIQAVRGMNDVLPDQTGVWQQVESTLLGVLAAYGYAEVRLPLLEKTELFKRSIGEVTDIVEKEMYTFQDRNGDSLTLRPEGTAGCVRAGIEHGLFHNQLHRMWYMGPMFRHERPQKGRYRQFHQIGVESFGLPGPDVDAELILMSARMWRALGLRDVALELNSLGTPMARNAYKERLVEYLKDHYGELDEDSVRRLETNPLRVLDSKNPDLKGLINGAPVLTEHLDQESREHFDGLVALLDAAGLGYRVNPRLVRGLDYYTKTVFEWVTTSLGAQGTVCAGGRFDGLVEQLGGKPAPAAGFALGLERLVALLQEEGGAGAYNGGPQVYVVNVGEAATAFALVLAEGLRDTLPDLRLRVHCGGGSFKSQFKHADRSGARFALIVGEDEVANGVVGVKDLLGELQQQSMPPDRVAAFLKHELL